MVNLNSQDVCCFFSLKDECMVQIHHCWVTVMGPGASKYEKKNPRYLEKEVARSTRSRKQRRQMASRNSLLLACLSFSFMKQCSDSI